MTSAANPSNSFVLLQIGGRRFALDAEIVAELAPPIRFHTFPHTSPVVSGVIVRRSRIVPVYDASPLLVGKPASAHRFYLIARRQFGRSIEFSALPVDGECELASGELGPPDSGQPVFIKGRVKIGEETIDVLDFESAVTQQPASAKVTHVLEVPS